MSPWGSLGLGGVPLNYDWLTATSFANLPSGKPANTIGFITSTAVPNVYFQNGTVSGMSTGDVVIRQGVTPSNPFNIHPTGKLYINVSGAYQYNGTLWVPISAYLYTGSAWVLLSEIYYDNGYIPSNIGTFLAYKIAGTTATVTLNADNVQFSVSSAYGRAYSQYKVDLTHISTLGFRAKVNNEAGMWAGYLDEYDASGSSTLVTATADYADYYLNVSAATGMKHIAFGVSASTTRSIYVKKIWGV